MLHKLRSGKPKRGKAFPMNTQTVTCRVCKRSVAKAQTICEDVQYQRVESGRRLGLSDPAKHPKIYGRRAIPFRRCRAVCGSADAITSAKEGTL